MKARLAFFVTRYKLSMKNILWLVSQWRYILLAVIAALLFFELIYWLFNASTLWIIMSSPNVSIIEKIQVLLSPFESIGQASGTTLLTMMIGLAILQGISIAALTYVIRRQKKIDDRLIGGSSFITLLAVIGLGCPACGTSLITPIVALFVSGSAVAVSEQIAAVVTPIALLIAAYGVYKLGIQIANTRSLVAQKIAIANYEPDNLH